MGDVPRLLHQLHKAGPRLLPSTLHGADALVSVLRPCDHEVGDLRAERFLRPECPMEVQLRCTYLPQQLGGETGPGLPATRAHWLHRISVLRWGSDICALDSSSC